MFRVYNIVISSRFLFLTLDPPSFLPVDSEGKPSLQRNLNELKRNGSISTNHHVHLCENKSENVNIFDPDFPILLVLPTHS